MCHYRTATETKRYYIERMGEPLGALFYALWQEVAWLHVKWQEYVELFGKKPSRVDLLNKAAPLFFRVVQDALWHDILMHIARLTDPPKSVGKPNLTIRRLPELVGNQELQELDSLVEKALKAAEFSRDWRNRRIAHRNLHLVLAQNAQPLAVASREKVREALAAIEEVLNWVEQHYTGGVTYFSPVTPPEGAETLLYVIYDGLKAREQREQRVRQGDYSDLRLPEI
ncbi:MAG: hypothetical protein H5T61_03375 [Thermoflexales bacterium]|nr:hypothetical protein [Thermoflexales bacterium]